MRDELDTVYRQSDDSHIYTYSKVRAGDMDKDQILFGCFMFLVALGADILFGIYPYFSQQPFGILIINFFVYTWGAVGLLMIIQGIRYKKKKKR